MKQKQVWQYRCDFCGERRYTKHNMTKHELHCTMNPDRKCRMCDLAELTQKPMSELTALFPKIEEFEKITEDIVILTKYSRHEEACENAFKELKDMTNGCPACCLAAIRQSKASVPSFDWNKESKKFLKSLTEECYYE